MSGICQQCGRSNCMGHRPTMSGKVGPPEMDKASSKLSYDEMLEEYERMARGWAALKDRAEKAEGSVAELEAEHAVMVEVFGRIQQSVFPLGTDAEVIYRLNEATASFSSRAIKIAALVKHFLSGEWSHGLGHAIKYAVKAGCECERCELFRALAKEKKGGAS